MTVDYAEAVMAHRFDLMDMDGRTAALIETTPQGEELLIVNVAVHPDFQGQGLGRRMLAFAEDLARQAGLKGMRLYTNKAFAANIALYLSVGYRVEREEARLGVTVHMVKPL